MTLPVLGLTFGDPGGVGPEIICRLLIDSLKRPKFIPVIFGSRSILNHSFLRNIVKGIDFQYDFDFKELKSGCIYFKDIECSDDFVIGRPDQLNGQLSSDYISEAVRCALRGDIDAIVTGPICKESLALAKIGFTGHTSMLKALSSVDSVSMAFYTSKLITVGAE